MSGGTQMIVQRRSSGLRSPSTLSGQSVPQDFDHTPGVLVVVVDGTPSGHTNTPINLAPAQLAVDELFRHLDSMKRA